MAEPAAEAAGPGAAAPPAPAQPDPEAKPDANAAPAPEAKPGVPADPDPDAVPDDEADADSLPRNPVGFQFHDRVGAQGALFLNIGAGSAGPGPGSGSGSGSGDGRRSTGRIGADEVDEALRYYLAPELYEPARAMLETNHVVVLVGKDGDGRRTGAYSLVRRVIGREPLIGLSPGYALKYLNDRSFRTGHGYLMIDRVGENSAEAEQRFEADRLRHKLRAAGAHLVITTTEAEALAWDREVVAWQRPDPHRLLDHCLECSATRLTYSQLTQAHDLVDQKPMPRDVVALCRRLAEDVDDALASGRDVARDRVRAWFADRPSQDRLLEVTAAAFGSGLRPRTFERLRDRLQVLVEEYAADRVEVIHSGEEEFPQSRAGWADEGSLVTTHQDDPTGPQWVVFRFQEDCAWVLTELHQRYGHELWEPLERWLREQAKSSEFAIRRRVSFGLALCAPHRFDEISQLLDEWSAGLVAERTMAAYVLSWICNLDGGLAPAALRIATRWADDRNPQKAWTAAIALGGELGVRYQSDALGWLWRLTTRTERISKPARSSIADLFREAVSDPAGAKTSVLKFVYNRMSRTLRDRDGDQVRTALDTALALLQAGAREVDEPVVARALRDQPESAGWLGRLWAELLRSAQHRADAVVAYHRTKRLVGRDAEAVRSVRALDGAIRTALTNEEYRIVRPWLERPPPDRRRGKGGWR